MAETSKFKSAASQKNRYILIGEQENNSEIKFNSALSYKTKTRSISAPVYIRGKLLSGIAGIAEGVYDFTAGTLDICWFTTGTPNITTV